MAAARGVRLLWCGCSRRCEPQAVAVHKEHGAEFVWVECCRGEGATEAGSCIKIDAIGSRIRSTACCRRMTMYNEGTVPKL